jgi:hypothetical protein
MILQAESLSPTQKSVIEELLGRQILDQDAISVHTVSLPSAAERQAATEKLRNFLQDTGRPSPNCSEEELEDALAEAMCSVRPTRRLLSETIRILEERGSTATLDASFSQDIEAVIAGHAHESINLLWE